VYVSVNPVTFFLNNFNLKTVLEFSFKKENTSETTGIAIPGTA